MDIQKKVASLNSRIAFFVLYLASARSGRVVPENSRVALVIFQRALDLGGYCRLQPHDHVSTTAVRFELLHSD